MNSAQILDEFRCALSDDNHFLINPIQLSKCGHSVCKDCLPKSSGYGLKYHVSISNLPN